MDRNPPIFKRGMRTGWNNNTRFEVGVYPDYDTDYPTPQVVIKLGGYSDGDSELAYSLLSLPSSKLLEMGEMMKEVGYFLKEFEAKSVKEE